MFEDKRQKHEEQQLQNTRKHAHTYTPIQPIIQSCCDRQTKAPCMHLRKWPSNADSNVLCSCLTLSFLRNVCKQNYNIVAHAVRVSTQLPE